jgi:hypothetical protein
MPDARMTDRAVYDLDEVVLQDDLSDGLDDLADQSERIAPVAGDVSVMSWCGGNVGFYCTFMLFACTALIVVPLCISYDGAGTYWDFVVVVVIGCLFWSAYVLAMYLRLGTRHDADPVAV